MEVNVEDINRGDRLVLMNGKEVIVESVKMRNGFIDVAWRSGQKLRKPSRNAGQYENLGTLKPCRVGDTVSILEHVKR